MNDDISPEMLQAGLEALIECRKRKKSQQQICVAVYLAMLAVKATRYLRPESESVH